jgi:ribosomal protein L20
MTGAKKILQWAKGFRGRAKNCISIARERVEKGLEYAYRDRKNKKRDFRGLWIQRINAGAREHGVRACAAAPTLRRWRPLWPVGLARRASP